MTDEFLWGAATAGHQIEGDNDNSDTWFLENHEDTVFVEPSGPACNSYERWPDDLAIVADMGCNAYRFSIEWARIEPSRGTFDSDAVDHYAEIIDACVARSIAPVVTYNHFTAPHWFALRGGFFADDAAETFARYCERVTEAFGDRIAYAMTLNEPNLHRVLQWVPLPEAHHERNRRVLSAVSQDLGVDRYRVANVVIPDEYDEIERGLAAAHLAARDAIRSVRADLPVGLSIAVTDDRVLGDDTTVRDRKRAESYDIWLEIARDDDWLGVQNYAQAWYDGTGPVDLDPPLALNDMGMPVHPASLAGAVEYCHSRSGIPVLVTEHGIAAVDDSARAELIPAAVDELMKLRRSGVPILGYLHWSLLDNFEWVMGYGPKFGLVEVDRRTFERTPKPSAGVYADVIARYGRQPT